ncbi:MAG: DUF1924 domain-containing protein [Pseudomonadales bacterium]|nr:DUF1924 domain-containing protein [Pseudomonadales bacterium]
MRGLCLSFMLLSLPCYGNEVLDKYLLVLQKSAVGLPFDAGRGEQLWYREASGRSCTSCHMDSPALTGRHQKTGKVIEAMAPSVNSARLTELKKMKKWLLRNCKWTFGRECTAQEKGDVLVWLREQ